MKSPCVIPPQNRSGIFKSDDAEIIGAFIIQRGWGKASLTT